MLDIAIADLEGRLGLKPGQPVGSGNKSKANAKANQTQKQQQKKKQQKQQKQQNTPSPEELAAQPEICKLQFKVGVITKVWNHPNADKLYCEEIDVGEDEPRQIASGLRPHFSLEEMMGQRLLVVANLKAKNLVKFKSHGMVLCAASKSPQASASASADGNSNGNGNSNADGERVEFVEPPLDAKPGDVVSFEGLPAPIPLAASQVEKKKIFLNCLEGMKTDDEGVATWNGHRFVVGSGGGGGGNYCRAKTICGGPMR